MTLLRSLLLVFAVFFSANVVTAAELAPRSSNAAGVKVVVTPKRIAADAATWEFAVELDTHSQDLSDDLLKTAVLVDAQGGRHAPLAWEGSPPGGHHRSGVLRFKGLGALPEAIELQILRSGETKPRSFSWKLK